MSGVVEVATVDDVTRWDADLRALTDGLGWLFNRPEPRVTLGLMVRALLADVSKKNSWGLAEHVGLRTPQPFEHLLNGARWDADLLRNAVRSYVVTGLADPGAALVLDDTQVIKQGVKSVGVAPRQRPHGHHRRPLGPGRRRSYPQAARSGQQQRLRHLLGLPPTAGEPTHP